MRLNLSKDYQIKIIPDNCTRCESPLYHAGDKITSPSSHNWLCAKCTNDNIKGVKCHKK